MLSRCSEYLMPSAVSISFHDSAACRHRYSVGAVELKEVAESRGSEDAAAETKSIPWILRAKLEESGRTGSCRSETPPQPPLALSVHQRTVSE